MLSSSYRYGYQAQRSSVTWPRSHSRSLVSWDWMLSLPACTACDLSPHHHPGQCPAQAYSHSLNPSHQLMGAEYGADGCQPALRRQWQRPLLPGLGPPSWALASVESPFVKQHSWARQGAAGVGLGLSVPCTSSGTSLAGQSPAGCLSWQILLWTNSYQELWVWEDR